MLVGHPSTQDEQRTGFTGNCHTSPIIEKFCCAGGVAGNVTFRLKALCHRHPSGGGLLSLLAVRDISGSPWRQERKDRRVGQRVPTEYPMLDAAVKTQIMNAVDKAFDDQT